MSGGGYVGPLASGLIRQAVEDALQSAQSEIAQSREALETSAIERIRDECVAEIERVLSVEEGIGWRA